MSAGFRMQDLVRARRDGRATAGRAARSPRRPRRSDPSISYWSEFFRPALIWRDADGAARAVRRSAAGSRRRPRSRCRARRCRADRSVENVSTGPVGSWRVSMNVARSAMTATTRWPVTKVIRSSQCEPMSPTARSAPPRSGCEPPVPVGLEEQPVLEVAAGHEPDVAELAAGDDLVGVLVERVEADVEVGGVDEAGSRPRARPARPTPPPSSPAASRRRRAGRRRGSPAPAATWRSLGEVTWTTSTVGSSRRSSSDG